MAVRKRGIEKTFFQVWTLREEIIIDAKGRTKKTVTVRMNAAKNGMSFLPRDWTFSLSLRCESPVLERDFFSERDHKKSMPSAENVSAMESRAAPVKSKFALPAW